MKMSVVVNTCALGPRAKTVTGSSTPAPHALRAYALEHFILPSLIDNAAVDEVIVVGEWRDDPWITYVPCPSVEFSCVDALAQRQAGFEASTGDVVAFTHDDHMIDPASFAEMTWNEADVWVPMRYRWVEGRDLVLPNGNGGDAWNPNSYIGGHAAFYTREALTLAPWGDVPKMHTWDGEHTKMLTDAGMSILWTEKLVVHDVEVMT